MRIKDEYIVTAMAALTVGSRLVTDNKYLQVYKGYISALGASIMQAGLLPSVILYENSPSSEADKSELINAIVYFLNNQFTTPEGHRRYSINSDLSTYILGLKDYQAKRQLLNDIEIAVVSIKMALRTYIEIE